MASDDRLTDACEPALTVCMAGLSARLKSGDEPEEDPLPPFPPQAVSVRTSARIEICQLRRVHRDEERRNRIMTFIVE